MHPSVHVSEWITHALRLNVKRVRLNCRSQHVLPPQFMVRYKFVHELVFNGVLAFNLVSFLVRVPMVTHLPFLTKLILFGVRVISDAKEEEVVFDFPVLQMFESRKCTWDSRIKTANFKVPQLKCASITDIRGDSSLTIKFCALGLTEFSYKGNLHTCTFDLSKAHLLHAKLRIQHYHDQDQLLSKFMTTFENVQSLKWIIEKVFF